MFICTIRTPEKRLETCIALLEGGVMITCFFACLLAPEARNFEYSRCCERDVLAQRGNSSLLLLQGWDTIGAVMSMSERDLVDMGIKKGHVRR